MTVLKKVNNNKFLKRNILDNKLRKIRLRIRDTI
jgi:hypothetical protein